jgi:sugar-specific transcriptional regulator TrmB
MIENLLKSLGFEEDDVKTYILLLELGSITAGNLAKKLGIPRSSLYGFLKRLTQDGLVAESQKRGVKIFTAEAPEKVNLLFAQKIEQLQKNQALYKQVLPSLKKGGEKFINPKFQTFEGAEGLKHALKDMLLYNNLETQALWPQKKMVEILTPDFFRYHNKERIKNNLSVRAIWPENQKVIIKDFPYFGIGNKFKREIKISPKNIDLTMGYWIYGNKTVFISSIKESFGFIIESAEFSQLMKIQFELLWQNSNDLKVNAVDTESFIKELNLPEYE